MNAIPQFTLLDAEPTLPQAGRLAVPTRRPQASLHRQRPRGRQMRLQLVARAEEADRRVLDAPALGRAAARLGTAADGRLIELHLHGLQAVLPPPSTDEGAPAHGLLLVAPCATAGADVNAFQGRAVVVGRRARSERLAGLARIEGPWLWLTPLVGDGPATRLPVADVRIWGEVVTLVRSTRQGTASLAKGQRSG